VLEVPSRSRTVILKLDADEHPAAPDSGQTANVCVVVLVREVAQLLRPAVLL
jgi:hypothetical protein